MSKNLYLRAGIYWARFKVNGVEYRVSLRTRSKQQAERFLTRKIDEVKARVYHGEKGPTSWPSAVVSWNTHCLADLGESTVDRYKTSLKQVRPFLDAKQMHEIDIACIRDLIKGRRKVGASTATIKRDLTAVSSVIEHAMEEGWMQSNPTLAVRGKRMKEKRDPIMLPQEASIRLMLKASPKRFADAQEFARETGMRQEEIFGLKRSQINAKSMTITIIGKGGKMRVIPYTAKAKAIVERQPPFLGSEIVFYHDEGARWQTAYSRFVAIKKSVTRKAAQDGRTFEPYRFHDLRHLYAVEYLRSGKGSVYDLRDLMGHSSVVVTEIYLEYLTPEEKKAAMHGGVQKTARGKRSARRGGDETP